jgi:hypothetical protein
MLGECGSGLLDRTALSAVRGASIFLVSSPTPKQYKRAGVHRHSFFARLAL